MIDDALTARLGKVRLLVTDVDGVLTDACMYYSSSGEELKRFNTRDGMGIVMLRDHGIPTAIITGENSEIVLRRAEKLQIEDVFLGVKDKVAVLDTLLDKHGLTYEQVAYIGDDVNDLEALKRVGLAVTVADGLPQVKEVAHYITEKKGGEGAVRELCDLLMNTQPPRKPPEG
jgi:3-deoxy-D-manno-octulosonate 8-phosphate phosphatase (KDO 8-P phosphatase)